MFRKNQFGHCFKGWIDYSPHFQHLEKLIEARDNGIACLVTYKALGAKQPREHRFGLDRIVSMHNALYALGVMLTENFKEIKHLTNFAVHRITDVILTDKKICFNVPQSDPGAFGLPWHERRNFFIRFKAGKAAEYVRERIWSVEQKMTTEADGSLLLEIVSCSEPEVLAWVRSFGEDAQLINKSDE